MPPILYLIDGHALAYRTYFALSRGGAGHFSTQDGEPTAGTYGFTSVILRLLEQEQPEYLAVAFDTGKTFRDEMYPEYKATREKMPDDLRPQIERIKEIVDTFKFPRLEKEGYEADDVLGSMAKYAVEQGFGVKIITGDRDLLQLVDDRIIVNLPGSKLSDAKDYTAEKVIDYMGVRPDQIVDYKALVGDASDNIPGVAGVGDKTAVSLLSTYATLDEIYANLDDVPKRVRTKLEAGKESAYLSYDLARIRTNLELALDLDEAKTDNIDFAAVEELFRKLEFRTHINKLHSLLGTTTEPLPDQQLSLFGEKITRVGVLPAYTTTTHLVNTQETLEQLVNKLQSSAIISFDTETTSTDAMNANIVGISLAVEEGEGYYIPVGHNKAEQSQLDLNRVLEALRPAFTDPDIAKAGHNLKYDCIVLSEQGLSPTPLSFDTMIAGWLVEPGSRHLGLKDMADDYLGIKMTHIEELIGKGKKQKSMADVSIDEVAAYAVADAEVPLRLMKELQKQLEQCQAVQLFNEIEMPLIPVLIEMERNGIALDSSFFDKMSSELDQRLQEIEKEVHDIANNTFNLNSTQQLSKVLFDDIGLKPPPRSRKTASGHYSTSADVLEEMRVQHPIIALVLEYRELAKLKSTYIDALPLQINPKTKRVHTSFNQIGSVTGRLASSNPNLQNIPARTELGRKVRQGFVAKPGMALLAVDYSQIELRIVAHMSADEAMLSAFKAGHDIHAATAAAIYNIPLDEVSKEKRRHAKAINFGLIYGMSAFGLSRTTDLTLGEAEQFSQTYFQQFPGVKEYLDNLRIQAAKEGFVETMLGRKRYFPNLQKSTNQNIRNREEREAINAPIQGTAADIIKIAMIQLPTALSKEKLNARILLQVHDELVLECKEDQIEKTAQVVQNIMENAFKLDIPLTTEARSGENWGALKPL